MLWFAGSCSQAAPSDGMAEAREDDSDEASNAESGSDDDTSSEGDDPVGEPDAETEDPALEPDDSPPALDDPPSPGLAPSEPEAPAIAVTPGTAEPEMMSGPEPEPTTEPEPTPEPEPNASFEPEPSVVVEPEPVLDGPSWCGEPQVQPRNRALCADDFACVDGYECLVWEELPYCVGDGGDAEARPAPMPPCDQGGVCPEGSQCDPSSPRAETTGCVYPICTSDDDCVHMTDAVCDPDHESTDFRGCRYRDCAKDEDYVCPAGTRCNDDPALARCQPLPCDDPESEGCAAPLVCGEGGSCQHPPCARSADCACGSCVKGQCQGEPGYCEPVGCP
jgi:hypothetical protein